MVNDASPDDPWPVIQKLASEDQRVKGINLSRNFGQHYAITAGLEYALGDWVWSWIAIFRISRKKY